MPERNGPTIVEVMTDPGLFGPWFSPLASWLSWVVFLRALFGLPMSPEQLAIYRRHTGRQTPPAAPAREAWMVIGRRGGKSRIAALVAVYLACFRDYRALLAPGERAEILVMAADMDQAGVIFGFARGLIEQVSMLAELLEREPANQTIHLRNRVTIRVKASNFRRVRGYTIVAGILDEVAFWPTGDESANPDTEVVKALKPAMLTVPNALLLGLSSPYAGRGVLWEAHKRHYGVDGDRVLVWQADTVSMHPSVDRSEIDQAYEDDPVAAASEYGAAFRRDIQDFVPREVVEALVITGRLSLAPAAGVRYHAFTDPSGGSQDSMTLAIAHRDARGRVILDVVPERRAPFSPEDVVREFAATLKEYRVRRVVGDRYGGEWPRERFREHGIVYEVAEPTKSDLYQALLPLLMSGQAELLDNKRLVAQLCALERRTSRAGKDSISHPPGGRDDVANAAAGGLVLAAARHQKMFEGLADAPPPREATLDDLVPRAWTCARCATTSLVGADVTAPRCARCNPGWTRAQILGGGQWFP